MSIGREPVSTPSASGPVPSVEREALAAVLAALQIPYAATCGEEEKRAKILEQRLLHTTCFLEGLLREDDHTPAEWHLDYFRRKLAEHPATGYVTSEQARARLAAGATWSEAVRPAEEVA